MKEGRKEERKGGNDRGSWKRRLWRLVDGRKVDSGKRLLVSFVHSINKSSSYEHDAPILCLKFLG